MESRYFISDQGVLTLDIQSDKIANEDTMNRVFEFLQSGLAKGHSLVLVDMRRAQGMTKKAHQMVREFGYNLSLTGAAIVADSPLSRILGSFYIGIFRPPYPIRLFNERTEAEYWLHSLEKQ
jgi:hypothetical protein